MAKGKLPSLKQVLGQPAATSHSGLPTVSQALGHGTSNLPSLKQVLNSPPPETAPAGKSSGGGFLGGLTHAGHWLANKTELAATDVKNIPGGLVQVAKVPAKEAEATYYLATGQTKKADQAVTSAHKQSVALAKGTIASTRQTVQHPLRDPFQTGLLATSVLSGGATAAARAGEAASAASEGGSLADIGKALLTRPPVKPRLLSKNGEQTPLQPSKNPLIRAAQALHDRAVQKAIDEKPDSRLAAYGTKRIGMAQDETGRYQARMRAVPAQALTRAAQKLNGKLPGHVGSRVEQAALELTSTNTAPEDAAAFHNAQADKGVSPARNRAVAKLYQKVADRGLLTKNKSGDVIVNAADHPRLAETDVKLAQVQGKGDQWLVRYGIRSPEDLQAAANKPAQYRAGATYEKPTPGKNGVPSQALLKAQQRVDRLQALYDKSEARDNTAMTLEAQRAAGKHNIVAGDLLPKHMGGRGLSPITERIGAALSVAKDDLQRIQTAAANRVKPTGVVGGEPARPGRGYVSYRGEEPKAPGNTAARSTGPVIGEARAPIGSHTNTGYNIQHGLVPKDITGQAARHFQQIARFVNTSERRAAAIRSGSELKQTSRDVLARIPGAEHEKIPATVNEILGKSKLTTDDLEGLNGALQEYREQLIPGLKDSFASDRNIPVGTSAKDAAAALDHPAPEGYRWVDRNILGELAKPGVGPRGKLARSFDNINSAVTAATVYFKVGHIGTRTLTNTAAAIIQGSAQPLQLAKSVKLWKALSDDDKMRALGAAGQHGYDAMPHEGASVASKVAGKGANWWARHVDAPFRFNSLAYEARKAGFDTPGKFKQMLDQAEDPAAHGLNAAQRAKVDWVLKRANREAIAYDRLSPFERQFISRAVWFYPWVRATGNFAANTLLEHPYKTAALGQAGRVGREKQAADLGDLPSYERGLFKLGGTADHPLVADFSTFSPFATPADVADVASVGQAAQFLNPVWGAGLQLATRQNQYGQHTNTPLTSALATLFSPTPEAQILTAYQNRGKNQARKMFHTTPGSALLRSLVGPGMPRRLNVTAAHSAAARERSGR